MKKPSYTVGCFDRLLIIRQGKSMPWTNVLAYFFRRLNSLALVNDVTLGLSTIAVNSYSKSYKTLFHHQFSRKWCLCDKSRCKGGCEVILIDRLILTNIRIGRKWLCQRQTLPTVVNGAATLVLPTFVVVNRSRLDSIFHYWCFDKIR